MGVIDIRTRLDLCASGPKHEIIYITRGATASLNFDFTSKVYGIDNVDQMTFSFKQGKNLFYYNAIEYFKATTDTVAVSGKVYYERIDANTAAASKYKFNVKSVAEGASVVGLYEKYEPDDTETTENWQFEKHFSYNVSGDYSWMNFMLSGEETKQFKVTEPDCLVAYEVAIKLNTDSLAGMHSMDSIIVEPQHPVAVVDSLYSKVSG